MNTTAIAPDETLAELASRLPAAARVFHRQRLDYCCGGQRSLAEACAAKGLDPDELRAEIAAEQALCGGDQRDWRGAPLPELIDHILQRYHEPHRRELPRLRELAAKVEAVHADHPHCPHGLADHLADCIRAVEEHLQKEEEVLFPLIVDGRGHDCAMPVRCLIEEHDDNGASLERTRQLAADFVVPEGACTSWRVLYQGLEGFERDLMAHVHLENHILFPRALAG
ncbi:MAG: iron-sulfur cluster repair di-iron protein [Planctomycetota bacterium]